MNKKKKILIVIGILFVLLFVGAIYKLSSMNSGNSNGKSSNIISIFIEDTLEVTNKYGITNSHPDDSKIDKASSLLNTPLRKVMHASVYFALAFIVLFVISMFFDNKKYILPAIITLAIIVLLAGFDEDHQTFVDGRTGQLKDVIIDCAGAVVGILFYGTYYYVYRRGYLAGKNSKSMLK